MPEIRRRFAAYPDNVKMDPAVSAVEFLQVANLLQRRGTGGNWKRKPGVPVSETCRVLILNR